MKITIELEPTNNRVESKVTIVDNGGGKSYLKIYDCSESVMIGFDKNSIQKIERLRVALDLLEENVKNKNNT